MQELVAPAPPGAARLLGPERLQLLQARPRRGQSGRRRLASHRMMNEEQALLRSRATPPAVERAQAQTAAAAGWRRQRPSVGGQ